MTFEEKLRDLTQGHEIIDLGYDHYLQPDFIGEALVGYLLYHKDHNTGDLTCGYINVCPGAVNRDGTPRPLWTVVSKDPLTLSPSVLTTTDGDHGWIQQGHWVKA